LKAILKGRHARIMEGRPDKGPGRFNPSSSRGPRFQVFCPRKESKSRTCNGG
jgi:hypothetical protein